MKTLSITFKCAMYLLFSNCDIKNNRHTETYIGTAFKAQSKTSRDASNPYWQKNYTVTDVLLGYQVDPNLNLSMNINNIFNEKYYTRVPSNFFGLYGEPRNVMLTLRYNYK